MSAAEPELVEVGGPSALGGGLRRSRDLLLLIAITEFKRIYFGTVLGYVWSVARPLLLFGVLLAVFTQALHISGVPHYPEVLLLGVVLFGFFQEATVTAVGSVVGQEAVVRKTQFPRLVIPLAVVLTSVFNLGLNLLVVSVFILALGITPAWSWLLLVVVLLALFVLTIAVSMIVSSLYPRLRDLGIIWTVFVTALFYATPVLYPIEHVSRTFRDVIAINPLAPILELARKWVIDPNAPAPWREVAGGHARFLIAAGIYVVVCALAVWVFQREAPRIAEAL